MAKVALSKEFQSGFHKLNSDVQKKVMTTLGKFGESTGSAGLNLESYNAAADPRARTVRVDKFWRAILAAPEDGDETYILFAVKSHDEADRWMAKNRFSVNALTKGLEVISDEDVKSVAESDSAGGPAQADKGLLAELPDKAFKQLGVTDIGLIGLIKDIPDRGSTSGAGRRAAGGSGRGGYGADVWRECRGDLGEADRERGADDSARGARACARGRTETRRGG